MKKERTWGERNIRGIDVTGVSYKEAIELAQKELSFFILLFKDRNVNNFKFFIKAKFEDGEHKEHLWLEVTSIINDEEFTGIVDSEPNNLTNIKYQDSIHLKKKDVEDWIIKLDDGEIFGNFIFHALKDNPTG